MRPTGPMALLTTHIPFRHRFGLNVVIHRMAAVAERARGPLHVVRGVMGHPPVGVWRNHVRAPDLVAYVPLRAERIIIIAPPGEIALLPLAAVARRDIALRQVHHRIGFGYVGKK